MKHPPQILLTRILLPLGLPLLTLGFTGAHPQQLNRIARHLIFFGSVGAAMGISIDRANVHSAEASRAIERDELSKRLKILIAAGGISDERTAAAASQLIEDLENTDHI